MDRYFSWLLNHQLWGWILLLLLCVGLVPGLGLLKVDNDLKGWYDDDSDLAKNLEKFETLFQGDNYYWITLTFPESIWENKNQAIIELLTRKFQNYPGVNQCLSITYFKDTLTEVYHHFPIAKLNAAPPPLPELIHKSPLWRSLVLGKNDRIAQLYILNKPGETQTQKNKRLEAYTKILKNNVPKDILVHQAGMDSVFYALDQISQRDIVTVSGLAMLVLFIVLAGLLRNWPLIAGGLGGVSISLILSMALLGYLGIPINILTAALPTLILAIGVADVLHISIVFRNLKNSTDQNNDHNSHSLN